MKLEVVGGTCGLPLKGGGAWANGTNGQPCIRRQGHPGFCASQAEMEQRRRESAQWRAAHPGASAARYAQSKVPGYTYAVYCDPLLKIGFSTVKEASQVTRTRLQARRRGFDFTGAEMIWSAPGSLKTERFIQAYADCVWGSVGSVGNNRSSEWFSVPGLDAESIVLNLKEWYAFYEELARGEGR